ncbi:MAG: voltage-gated potassium channel [Chloroflexi bacterium]|nr:MAG: voltage-gated potassium channel [Chloroflexota bacterium]
MRPHLPSQLGSRLPTGPAVAKLRYSLAGLLLVVGIGVGGYVWIADFSPFDALYQTVLTVTTIGFQEVNPMGRDGRAFTIVLSIVGVTMVLFVMGSAATVIFEGDVRRDWGAWRMTRQIDALRDHVIVCGAGRVGREVVRELAARHREFVIVDRRPESVGICLAEGWPVVEGDASNHDVLRQAGADRASGLVVATDSDAQNTFITLTAKGVNPSLYVVARSADPEAEATFAQAGADRVISPTTIAGRRMALAIVHPSVVDFAETVLRGGGDEPVIAQIDISAGAAWEGMTIAQAFAERPTRVLGLRAAGGPLDVAPSGRQELAAGMSLMVYGRTEEIEALSSFTGAPIDRR